MTTPAVPAIPASARKPSARPKARLTRPIRHPAIGALGVLLMLPIGLALWSNNISLTLGAQRAVIVLVVLIFLERIVLPFVSLLIIGPSRRAEDEAAAAAAAADELATEALGGVAIGSPGAPAPAPPAVRAGDAAVTASQANTGGDELPAIGDGS